MHPRQVAGDRDPGERDAAGGRSGACGRSTRERVVERRAHLVERAELDEVRLLVPDRDQEGRRALDARRARGRLGAVGLLP